MQKFEFAPNRSKLAHKTSGATYARVERGRNFFFVRISPQRSPGPIQMKFGTFGHFRTERIGPMTQTQSVKLFRNTRMDREVLDIAWNYYRTRIISFTAICDIHAISMLIPSHFRAISILQGCWSGIGMHKIPWA